MVKITDPNPVVEEILQKIEAREAKTIVDPITGKPLLEPLVDDRTVTYAKDGQSYSIKPEELLMRAARMSRDGMSLKAIRSELDLISSGPQEVTLRALGDAIKYVGMPLLDQAIREGREPEESVTVLGYAAPEGADEGDEGTTKTEVYAADPHWGPEGRRSRPA